jgi:uncharacterized protein (TIGR01370 family)
MFPNFTSYAYIICPLEHIQPIETTLKQIEKSPYDMVILGNVNKLYPNLVHNSATPLVGKHIISYIDVGACNGLVAGKYLNLPHNESYVFDTSKFPTWFGKPEPGYNNLWTVQFWNNQWFEVIKKQIDDQISAGYDGVFLDEISADEHWFANNQVGNATYTNASLEMANLLKKINDYVDSKNLPKPFYIVANNPDRLVNQYSWVKNTYDIAFKECFSYVPLFSDGKVSVPSNNTESTFKYLQKTYTTDNILLTDYIPLNSVNETIPILAKLNKEGYVPSLQKPFPDIYILNTGPFVIQANNVKTTVKGADYGLNYLLSGEYGNTTLIGGNTENYYVMTNNSSAIGNNKSDTFYVYTDKVLSTKHTIDGNLGVDTVIYDGSASNFKLRIEKNGVVKITSTSFNISDEIYDTEFIRFVDKTLLVESKPHKSYTDIPDLMYKMLTSVFDIAPGVEYMDALVDAYRYLLPNFGAENSIKKILGILIDKPFFTDNYPKTLSHKDFSSKIVGNMFENTLSDNVRNELVNTIESVLKLGWSREDVLFTVLTNWSKLSVNDPVYGEAAKLLYNETQVAKFYTDYINQSTTDLKFLDGLMDAVNSKSQVITEEQLITLVGNYIMDAGYSG